MPETKNQCLILEDKSILKINGIDSVIALNETDCSVVINNETLCIKGTSLKAEKLSVETGELVLVGTINMIKYEQKHEKKSFFKRIFK